MQNKYTNLFQILYYELDLHHHLTHTVLIVDYYTTVNIIHQISIIKIYRISIHTISLSTV